MLPQRLAFGMDEAPGLLVWFIVWSLSEDFFLVAGFSRSSIPHPTSKLRFNVRILFFLIQLFKEPGSYQFHRRGSYQRLTRLFLLFIHLSSATFPWSLWFQVFFFIFILGVYEWNAHGQAQYNSNVKQIIKDDLVTPPCTPTLCGGNAYFCKSICQYWLVVQLRRSPSHPRNTLI